MTLTATIQVLAAQNGLMVAGHAPVLPEDGLHTSIRSVLMLAPNEPSFWPQVSTEAEFEDGAPDPLDRWSRRVIGKLACDTGTKAYFPFGGPPFQPFISWATRSGRAWPSPVGLLVHDSAGLFISYRGAIGLTTEASPAPEPSPCVTCADQPCRTACPAGALTPAGYDVPSCKSWLDTAAGSICRTDGCLVRRACPVGASRRLPAQSAFHMEAFAPR